MSVYTGAPNGYSSALGTINVGYTPFDGTRIGAIVRGRSSSFNLDDLGFPAYDANNYMGTDSMAFGSLNATSKLFDGIWQTTLVASRLQSNRNYVEPLEFQDPNQAFGTTRYRGTVTDVQWNNIVNIPDTGPAKASALTFGYEHTINTSSSALNTSTDGFPYDSSVSAQETTYAGHVGLQSTLWDRLTLTGDLRQEGAQ